LLILELKNDDSQERYVRCLLESYTYLKTIKRPSDFLNDVNMMPGKHRKPNKITICPLFFADANCRPFIDSMDKGPNVRRLEEMIRADPDVGGVVSYAFTKNEQKVIFDEYNRLLDEEASQ